MAKLRQLRPTRRGVGAAGIVGLALGLGLSFGMRSLGAVVVPGAFALAIGAVQLVRADAPRIARSEIEDGFPGERRTVRVAVDSSTPCTVVESVGDGLSVCEDGEETVTAAVGHGGRFEYTVELERRGEHRLGPARCRVVDSFGLFSASFDSGDAVTALVYPRTYEIGTGAVSQLTRRGEGTDRSTFERLREYTTEDSMRDIHWRASAKRPDAEFLVAEYESHQVHEDVRIVGESEAGGADAMASAVASLTVQFGDLRRPVTVVVADGDCTSRPGESIDALRLLARTDGGAVAASERDRADVHVTARGDDVTVTAFGRTLDIDPDSPSSSEARNSNRLDERGTIDGEGTTA